MSPSPDPILPPETDQTGQTLSSGHAVPEDPPHQTGSTGQAENPESTFYKRPGSRQARLRSNRLSVGVSANTNQDILIGAPVDCFTLTLVAGLMVFGAVFAINSAIHSCLIVAVIETERVTPDVGF